MVQGVEHVHKSTLNEADTAFDTEVVVVVVVVGGGGPLTQARPKQPRRGYSQSLALRLLVH
jgi:hypothetical protein